VAKSRRGPEEAARRRPADDDDDDDAPRRKRDRDDDEPEDRPFKPRKKKKSAAGPVKMVLRIVGAVIGAVGLVILLYWVYTPIGTDSSMLCYLPKETTSLQGYDVDDAYLNSKLAPVHQVIMTNYRSFGDRRWNTEAAGVNDTDVLRYLHGTAAGNPDEEKDLPPQQKRGELTVIRFRRAVDEGQFVGSFTGAYHCEEQAGKDGKKFYQLWTTVKVPPDGHEERQDDISFFFPNSKTLVYATTRRELTEAMTRTPGKVVLEGTIRELADKVDGCYFSASGGFIEEKGLSNSMAFSLGFTGDEFKDERKSSGVIGTASWFTSNGNDFLYASANMYGDLKVARDVRNKLQAAFTKAQSDIWQNDTGRPGGLYDPFNPPKPKAAPGGPIDPMAQYNPGPTSEQAKDVMEALSEYARSARAYNRGRLVIVEGLIPHGPQETGVFEKFWTVISPRYQVPVMMGGAYPGGPGGMMPGRPPGR
jgi:hypothetical protein